MIQLTDLRKIEICFLKIREKERKSVVKAQAMTELSVVPDDCVVVVIGFLKIREQSMFMRTCRSYRDLVGANMHLGTLKCWISYTPALMKNPLLINPLAIRKSYHGDNYCRAMLNYADYEDRLVPIEIFKAATLNQYCEYIRLTRGDIRVGEIDEIMRIFYIMLHFDEVVGRLSELPSDIDGVPTRVNYNLLIVEFGGEQYSAWRITNWTDFMNQVGGDIDRDLAKDVWDLTNTIIIADKTKKVK